MLWASSDQLLGIHAAPPCGTCSAARQIVLRDSSGSRIPQPVPLRSQVYPDGLPNLHGKDKVRVDAANRLYAFLVKLLTLCHARGLVFCVENPRSSWFWQTSFWKSLVCPTTFTVHQACAYGGQRPKWTALAPNTSRKFPACARVSVTLIPTCRGVSCAVTLARHLQLQRRLRILPSLLGKLQKHLRAKQWTEVGSHHHALLR